MGARKGSLEYIISSNGWHIQGNRYKKIYIAVDVQVESNILQLWQCRCQCQFRCYPASRQQGELQGKRKGQDIITPSCPNIICRRCCLRYVLRCSKCPACPIYAFKLNKFHYLRAISCSLHINCIVSIYDYIVCRSCLSPLLCRALTSSRKYTWWLG